MKKVAPALACAVLLACCGGDDDTPERPRAKRASDPTCAELRDTARLRRLARRLVVRVVAPDGQSEAETADLIAGSLRATCRQAGRARHRPVEPVLRAVQRHLDEEAVFGGR